MWGKEVPLNTYHLVFALAVWVNQRQHQPSPVQFFLSFSFISLFPLPLPNEAIILSWPTDNFLLVSLHALAFLSYAHTLASCHIPLKAFQLLLIALKITLSRPHQPPSYSPASSQSIVPATPILTLLPTSQVLHPLRALHTQLHPASQAVFILFPSQHLSLSLIVSFMVWFYFLPSD